MSNGIGAKAVFAGEGEMAQRLRAFDWSQTPLGPVEQWPQSLKTCVRIMLTSRQPMFVWWGDDLINLYNDAYKTILRGKHPRALGQRASVVWQEIWDQVGPRAESAMLQNEGTYDEALLLIMERNDYPEETYYTFSYSPVPNDQGGAGGILCANTEDTPRIISERQLALLRELAAKTANARTWQEACTISARCLSVDNRDLPFALMYVAEPKERQLVLAGSSGIAEEHAAAPPTIALASDSVWPIAVTLAANQPRMVSNLEAIFGHLPTGPWDRPPSQAVVQPIAGFGQTGRSAVLIVGLNPYRVFDDGYRGFLDLVSGQIGSSIANAQAYEDERKRAEALAELDRAKTAFFSNVSHEFRTPLTLMLGPLEDILAQPGDNVPSETYEMLTLVHRNGMRLLKLVNSLLDFARIESGRVQAVYEPTDLARLTADLASVFRSATERAGLRLVVDCPPLPEPVYVDRDMWETIVLNLISNAFKFTFDGEILVALHARIGAVELEVRDTGVGIPEAEVPHLFEHFHRVEGTRARTHEGSGIGLALVQELARLHAGTVHVRSAHGHGSTFTVRIPTGTAHLDPDRIQSPRTQQPTGLGAAPYVEEALRWLPEEEDRQGGDSTVGHLDQLTPHFFHAETHDRARILIVDDNADMRDYVRRLLRAEYEVEAVGDGLAALASVRSRRPDLVLADVMMPNLDGFGLLRMLREDPSTRTIPVILLSARAGEEARVEGLEAGSDDYIVKPFGARELLARIAASLELSQVRDEVVRAVRTGEQRLYDLVMQAPALICLLRGPDHIIELANPPFVQSSGTDRPLLGRPVREAIPEMESTGYFERLDQVYATGTSFVGKEERILVNQNSDGRVVEGYYSFVFQPTHDAQGAVDGVLVHAVDVTEQVRARQAVEAAVRARDEFLSVAAHELKTPVAGIKGSAQLLDRLLQRGDLDDMRLRRFVRSIVTASDRLATLTNDLLDVSRIQTGRLTLERTPLDLRELVRDVVDQFRDGLDGRHGLTLAVPQQACTTLADPSRLEQVLLNLLDNALKYSPDGGPIEVTVGFDEDILELRVRDSGIGLPPGSFETIFEPFGRAINATQRHLPGMGLGLYICRTIVEQHGGRLWAESEGENQGTAFVMTLPPVQRAEEVSHGRSP